MANPCTTYTVPFTSPPATKSIDIRPLSSIEPCAVPKECPPIPSPRQDIIHDAYVLSTHIIPAVSPRMVPDLPLPNILPYSVSVLERQTQTACVVHELRDRQTRFTQGDLKGEPSLKPLWNCINRHVRRRNYRTERDGITLFLAHANGFPKEIWESMLNSLFDLPAATLIAEVWSWEAVQHGDSALLNAQNLSGIYESLDNSRDIANFLLHYLPDEASPTSLPTHLSRVPEATSSSRVKLGFSKRKVVVVGHSFGGTTSVLTAFNFPKLFSSLILVDPIVTPPGYYDMNPIFDLPFTAFIRRDRWPSREDAYHLFKQSPFFSVWHPAVLRSYVDHGLTDDPNGGVKLKTSPAQEALNFLNFRAAEEAWVALRDLDEGITLRWIVSGTSKYSAGTTVWLRSANSSNIVFSSVGHLIVQEAPIDLAREITGFLLEKYGPRIRAYL